MLGLYYLNKPAGQPVRFTWNPLEKFDNLGDWSLAQDSLLFLSKAFLDSSPIPISYFRRPGPAPLLPVPLTFLSRPNPRLEAEFDSGLF